MFPSGERDVLLAGDLNASRYDSHQEGFWSNFDPNGFRFKTLSPEDGTEYPGTRLAGVPLFPRSQIDYLLASGSVGGLTDELVQLVGHVHTELLPANCNDFRRRFSDHLPVTVRIMVILMTIGEPASLPQRLRDAERLRRTEATGASLPRCDVDYGTT